MPAPKKRAALVLTVLCTLHASVRLSAQTYTVNTSTLTSYDNVHPKLFTDSSRINSIKANITSAPAGTRWSSMWIKFIAVANRTAAKPPAVYTTPGASDEQLWQREVGDNISTLAAAATFTKTALPSMNTIWIEAEDSPLLSPMALQTDAAASGARSIGTPVGGAVNNPNTQPLNAVYPFTASVKAYYHAWARVYAPSSSSASFWLKTDGEEHNISTTAYGSWVWVNCGHWNFEVDPGICARG